MNKHSPHLSLAHAYWKEILQNGGIAIDATCGNGHDTVQIAQLLLSNSDSWIYALDVQQCALDSASNLFIHSLPELRRMRISLHKICHSELDRLPLRAAPRLIVYNLGYLPGGDKTLTTQTATTLLSLEKAELLLAPGGAISATCYPGHPEGDKEEKAVIEWAEQLSCSKWQVCHHKWISRKAAPSLLWIRSLA